MFNIIKISFVNKYGLGTNAPMLMRWHWRCLKHVGGTANIAAVDIRDGANFRRSSDLETILEIPKIGRVCPIFQDLDGS